MSTPLLRASAVLHAAGLAGIAAAPRLWPWIVGAFVIDHAALFGAGLWPKSRLLGPNTTRLPGDAASAGEVALTFDDGPDPEVTPRVMDLLEARGARGTFFAIGRRAREHATIVGDAARRGHLVENHTFTHTNAFSVLPPWVAAREIDEASRVIAKATRRAPAWFRAPAGFRPPWIESVLRPRGLRLVSWTRRGFDTVDRDPRRVAGRLTEGLSAGDILLLHDAGCARTSSGTPVVLEALPRVLDAIEAAGLKPVPLPPSR